MRLPVVFGDGESERHFGDGAGDVFVLGILRVTGKNWRGGWGASEAFCK